MITLVIGIGLIAVAFLQPEFIFGSGVAPLDISDISGLTLIDVPIDPTGGQILGTVKFGAPIVVPFERSGTVLSAGACETPRDLDDLSLGFEVKFGRIASGDRNSEVFFHGFNGVNCAYGYAEWDLTDLPNDFVATGFTLQLNLKSIQSGQQSCKIGFIVDTFDEIGERAIANRMVFGTEFGGNNRIATTLGGATPIDPITGKVVPHDFLAVGHFVTNQPKFDNDWCESTGVKKWTFSKIEATGFRVLSDGTVTNQPTGARLNTPIGVESFNQQLQFNQLTQKGNDKFMLVFYGGSSRGGSSSNVIDQQWWEENGSLLVTGSSQPIRCGVGFNQVGFKCIPIVCDITETLNLITNECEAIVCDAGLELEIKEFSTVCTTGIPEVCNTEMIAVCTKINPCSPQEIFIDDICQSIEIIQPQICDEGTQIVGSECEPLFCGEGFEISGNACILKTCNIGQELIGDQCQTITCPLNTRLIGNDCVEISCPMGQIVIDNKCVNISSCSDCGDDGTIFCDVGLKQIGDQCVPIELDCPAGTEEFENNCRNIAPSLLQISGVDSTIFLITGLVITGMSGVGIVARRR